MLEINLLVARQRAATAVTKAALNAVDAADITVTSTQTLLRQLLERQLVPREGQEVWSMALIQVRDYLAQLRAARTQLDVEVAKFEEMS